MLVMTEDAIVVCAHELGDVSNRPSQKLVTVNGRRMLVDDDPEGRGISKCPNIGPTMRPCQKTLKVQQGYSSLIRINGKRVCLETVEGLTDGTPPGTVKYHVRTAGQHLVRSGS